MGRPRKTAKMFPIEYAGSFFDKLKAKNLSKPAHVFYSPLLDKFKFYLFMPELKDGYVLGSGCFKRVIRKTRWYYIGDL